jgi:hypothetical protein
MIGTQQGILNARGPGRWERGSRFRAGFVGHNPHLIRRLLATYRFGSLFEANFIILSEQRDSAGKEHAAYQTDKKDERAVPSHVPVLSTSIADGRELRLSWIPPESLSGGFSTFRILPVMRRDGQRKRGSPRYMRLEELMPLEHEGDA